MKYRAYLVALLVILIWGITFANTRTLLEDFSALEIQIVRFAAAFSLWNLACRELGVVRTTIGLYLTPIVGIIFAALFLDERLTVMSLSGGVLILIGVIAATFKRR